MFRSVGFRSAALLLAVGLAEPAAAAEPGFRLAGHSGVALVEENETFRVSRGTDDLIFVWSKQTGAPRAWRRIEPDAGTLVQGDRVALFGDDAVEWLGLPGLETVSRVQVAGSVSCRGAALAWSWSSDGVVTLHDGSRSEQLGTAATPGEDASCLISPLGTILIWSEENGVSALVHGGTTQLLSATVANDGIVDAGASASALWATVRVAGTDKVTRTALLGALPAAPTSGSGWRTCDTFDAAGQPLACVALSPSDAAPVSRPLVPAWNRALWQTDRIALGAPGAAPALQASEAGWAVPVASPHTAGGERGSANEVVVRGRRLKWRPVWMAGCAQQAWQVEEQTGGTEAAVAGPICGELPRWVPTPDDRWAMLQIPGRASALVWSERSQPTRLALPDAPDLALTMALRDSEGWWVADAAQAHAWRQGGGDTPGWTDAAVPLMADRTLTLSRSGEVLTLRPANGDLPETHFIVSDRGTVAWQQDGAWWADEALLPQLVWVGEDGTPFPTDDPSVSKRFEKRLLVRLWDRLIDER